MSELIEKTAMMINQFVTSKGVNINDVYDATNKKWYLKKGSSDVQILLLSVPVGPNYIREFVQAAAPIIKIPAGKELQFYRRCLELNDVKLGVKISIQKDTDQVWALAERDLIGLDYKELETLLEDLGYWADEFDDLLKGEFY